MKKGSEIATGILAVMFSFGAAAYAIEADMMGNLAETSGKISSIDMDKNFGEAGRVLDGFYSGMTVKKEASPAVVSLGAGSQRTPAQAEEEVCNANPSKIGRLASKVPALWANNSFSGSRKRVVGKKSSMYLRCGDGKDGCGSDPGKLVEDALDGFGQLYRTIVPEKTQDDYDREAAEKYSGWRTRGETQDPAEQAQDGYDNGPHGAYRDR